MKKFLIVLLLMLNVGIAFSATSPKINKASDYRCSLEDSYEVCVNKTKKQYLNDTVLKNKFKGIYDDILVHYYSYGVGPAIYLIALRRSACIRYLVEKNRSKVIPDEYLKEHLENLEKETQYIVNRLAESQCKEIKTEKVFTKIYSPLDSGFQSTPQRIKYGYNAVGDYAPSSIGDKRVNYSYNAVGDYVPTSIGNQRVNYSYNAVGDYVPTSIGGQRVNYGYNAVGDYAPTSIGGQRIQYGYNAMGDYVPMSVGGRRIKYDFNAYGDYVPMGY